MYYIAAYSIVDNRYKLEKEINLDNKFKADRCWAGLYKRYPLVMMREESGAISIVLERK